MREVEHWRWWICTDLSGKRHKSSWHMSREDALQHDPNATPVEGTMETQQILEPHEYIMNSRPCCACAEPLENEQRCCSKCHRMIGGRIGVS